MDNQTEGDGTANGPSGHDGRSNGLEIDEKRKELEVAEIMCGIQQKNNQQKTGDDVQQKAIDSHHQRQAEQITGATPFHLQKSSETAPNSSMAPPNGANMLSDPGQLQSVVAGHSSVSTGPSSSDRLNSGPGNGPGPVSKIDKLPFVQFTPTQMVQTTSQGPNHTIRIVNDSEMSHINESSSMSHHQQQSQQQPQGNVIQQQSMSGQQATTVSNIQQIQQQQQVIVTQQVQQQLDQQNILIPPPQQQHQVQQQQQVQLQQQQTIQQVQQQQQQQQQQQPTIELVELVDNKTDENGQNFQVYQTQNGNQIIQTSDGQFHSTTSGENQEFVYEDTQYIHDGQIITKTEQFDSNNQQIIITDPEYTEEIYTDGAQEQITYLDETGNEIGESHRPQGIKLQSIKNIQPVYIQNGQRRKSIIQMRQNSAPKIQLMDSSGEAQFIQIQQPSTSQQIQLAPIRNNAAQKQPVVYYQTILLPPQNSSQNNASTLQVQNPNIIQMSTKNSNQSSNVIFLSPNGTIETQHPTYKLINTNQKIEYVKVDQNNQSLLDIAATQAGIDLKSEQDADQKSKPIKTEQVQSHHAYPSPFSQIPIADRTHQCKYCPKRFARADECKRHERIHTDTRPFSCTYCPRAFTRKDHLRTHTRCHTKEKPYICPLCSRGFARSDERIRHIKTHVKKGECTMAEAKKKLGNVTVGRRPTRNLQKTQQQSQQQSPSPVIMNQTPSIPITIQQTDSDSVGTYFKTSGSNLTDTITLNPGSSISGVQMSGNMSDKITIIEEASGNPTETNLQL